MNTPYDDFLNMFQHYNLKIKTLSSQNFAYYILLEMKDLYDKQFILLSKSYYMVYEFDWNKNFRYSYMVDDISAIENKIDFEQKK